MTKKILIVDDEQIIRDSVRVSLESEGYDIHEAGNGTEAVEKAREIVPDLVVLDLMMPDKWGFKVCEEIRSQPETGKVAVLFLTGRKSALNEKMGEIKGGDDFMTKPFRPAELREKVKKLLEIE